MITIFYIIKTILIYVHFLGFSLNARPYKWQRFSYYRVEIKVVVSYCPHPFQDHVDTINMCMCRTSRRCSPLQAVTRKIYHHLNHLLMPKIAWNC